MPPSDSDRTKTWPEVFYEDAAADEIGRAMARIRDALVMEAIVWCDAPSPEGEVRMRVFVELLRSLQRLLIKRVEALGIPQPPGALIPEKHVSDGPIRFDTEDMFPIEGDVTGSDFP